jgi:hypothetical protein
MTQLLVQLDMYFSSSDYVVQVWAVVSGGVTWDLCLPVLVCLLYRSRFLFFILSNYIEIFTISI